MREKRREDERNRGEKEEEKFVDTPVSIFGSEPQTKNAVSSREKDEPVLPVALDDEEYRKIPRRQPPFVVVVSGSDARGSVSAPFVGIPLPGDVGVNQQGQLMDGDEAGDEDAPARKRFSDYSEKTLAFGIMMLACMHSSLSTLAKHMWVFKATAMLLLFAFISNLASMVQPLRCWAGLPPKWKSFLVCLSCFFFLLMYYFLLVSINYYNAFAPLGVLLLLLPAGLQRVQCFGAPQEADEERLQHIFNTSAVIIGSSSLVGMIFGGAMSRAADGLGFFVFCVIFVASYLMVIITVRPPKLIVDANILFNNMLMVIGVMAIVDVVTLIIK